MVKSAHIKVRQYTSKLVQRERGKYRIKRVMQKNGKNFGETRRLPRWRLFYGDLFIIASQLDNSLNLETYQLLTFVATVWQGGNFGTCFPLMPVCYRNLERGEAKNWVKEKRQILGAASTMVFWKSGGLLWEGGNHPSCSVLVHMGDSERCLKWRNRSASQLYRGENLCICTFGAAIFVWSCKPN